MLTIAIDGTSASGKSKIASLIAEHYNIGYFNTGEIYRTITHILLVNNVKPTEVDKAVEVLRKNKITLTFKGIKQQIYINEKLIDFNLKSTEINENVALYSKEIKIREFVIQIQRKYSEKNDIVMEGRDIGTNVLPNAKFKFFLGAENQEKTKRRIKQLKEMKVDFEEKEISQSLFERDLQDITRECKPLTVAEDGFYIDTTKRNIQEVFEYIISIIEKNKE